MIELLRLGKKSPMTQTTDISNDQLHFQPTTDSPTNFTEEHTNTTPQKSWCTENSIRKICVDKRINQAPNASLFAKAKEKKRTMKGNFDAS